MHNWASIVWVLAWAGVVLIMVVGCCRSVGRGSQPARGVVPGEAAPVSSAAAET
jgi:hypothetical protein